MRNSGEMHNSGQRLQWMGFLDPATKITPNADSQRRFPAACARPLRATASPKRMMSPLPIALLLCAVSLVPARSAEPTRIDRDNLLLFRDAGRGVAAVRSPADWELRRSEILAGMQSITGALPGAEKRGALDSRIEEETDAGDHLRRRITYDAEPGGRAHAFLLVPKSALDGKQPAPAVLALHPTNNTAGSRTIVEEGIAANRHYGLELARRGYVVLAPAYPHLAGYAPDLKSLGYESGTMKAVWDNIRGLDLLETLPFVKRGGFAAIGHSLGGHNAVYTAVFDKRILAVVSSCGLDSYTDYYAGKPELWTPGKGWCQERYMPRLADYRGRLAEIPFDFQELIGALAPRKVLIIAPIGDANFQWRSVDRVARAATPVFALLGAAENLRVIHPDCTHDFPDAMREEAYRWIDSVLKPAAR